MDTAGFEAEGGDWAAGAGGGVFGCSKTAVKGAEAAGPSCPGWASSLMSAHR